MIAGYVNWLENYQTKQQKEATKQKNEQTNKQHIKLKHIFMDMSWTCPFVSCICSPFYTYFYDDVLDLKLNIPASTKQSLHYRTMR